MDKLWLISYPDWIQKWYKFLLPMSFLTYIIRIKAIFKMNLQIFKYTYKFLSIIFLPLIELFVRTSFMFIGKDFSIYMRAKKEANERTKEKL